jgi:hypothetical protein
MTPPEDCMIVRRDSADLSAVQPTADVGHVATHQRPDVRGDDGVAERSYSRCSRRISLERETGGRPATSSRREAPDELLVLREG